MTVKNVQHIFKVDNEDLIKLQKDYDNLKASLDTSKLDIVSLKEKVTAAEIAIAKLSKP